MTTEMELKATEDRLLRETEAVGYYKGLLAALNEVNRSSYITEAVRRIAEIAKTEGK